MFRQSRAGKTAVALSVALGVVLIENRASGQVKLFPDQCEAALSIAALIMRNYDISRRLIASFEKFRRSDCDIDTSFERDTQTDVMAFGEFKMRFEMWRTCTDNPLAKVCAAIPQ